MMILRQILVYSAFCNKKFEHRSNNDSCLLRKLLPHRLVGAKQGKMIETPNSVFANIIVVLALPFVFLN